MKTGKQKTKQFLEDLASKKPAPGGGSASALAGAMAAALVAKVACLTVGKKRYKEVEKEFEQLGKQAVGLLNELLSLVDEDAKAYGEVVKASNYHTTVRGSYLRAIKKAAEVPLRTAKKSLRVLKMAIYASEYGNENLRSDAFSAIELAQAAIYGALENVRANLPFIKEKGEEERIRDEMEEILGGTEKIVKS